MAHGGGHSSGVRRMNYSNRSTRESAVNTIGRMLYKLAPDGSLKRSALRRSGPKFVKAPKGRSY